MGDDCQVIAIANIVVFDTIKEISDASAYDATHVKYIVRPFSFIFVQSRGIAVSQDRM